MTAMRKIWATRVNNATASTYVGKKGTIFFDELTGALRISDGTTVGGQPLTLVASDFAFQFGDFVATTPANGAAQLQAQNTDQNIDIVTNGTGVINIVGDFHVHRTQGWDDTQQDLDGAVFTVKGDGQVQMKVPLADSTTAALEIVGNDSGLFLSPNQTGVILHVTGNSGLVSRNYFDANANYSLLVGRRYNGTQLAPTKVLNGEMFFRIAGQAATQATTETAVFQTFGPCQIDWVATEDQGPNNQGGELRFRVTPNGANAQTGGIIAATINATTGLTATKFNGPLAGNVVATTVTATNFVGTITTVAQPNITSVGTLTNLTVANTVTSTYLSGRLIRPVRDAGTIGAGGTLTIDFTTDSIVHCVWSDGMTLAYQNFAPGRVIKIMATKATGSGTDSLSLDGVTGTQTSSGGTSVSASADTTVFIECISTTSSITGLYIKL